MSQLQPGTGYTFSASSSGVTINIDKPFLRYDSDDSATSLSLEMLSIFPFKIAKSDPANSGSWADLLEYLATAAAELTPYVFVPQTGNTFRVLPGTINGVVCDLGLTACEDGDPAQNIYLQTYPYGDEQIIATTSILTDSDTASYVLLGVVDYAGKTQMTMNSLVMERFKCGETDAVYWYSKI
jgi:hypothetical protein